MLFLGVFVGMIGKAEGMEADRTISRKELDVIVSELREIAPPAIDDVEKLKELAEYLLKQKHSGPCNAAILLLGAEAERKGINGNSRYQKINLIIDIINSMDYNWSRDAVFFIDRYRNGFYANWEPKYEDYAG
jgi:hypothetical protein